VKKRSRFYPRVQVDTSNSAAVGQAGGVLLTDTVAAAGLDVALSAALSPWRRPLAVHDPGKVVLDLALTLALGGDCLADVALLRAEPGVYGLVASDPTVSRTVDALAATHLPRSRRSTLCGPRPGPRCGSLPASTPPTTRWTPQRRWSSTSTRPW
jgi:Transposase DDE domain group 1